MSIRTSSFPKEICFIDSGMSHPHAGEKRHAPAATEKFRRRGVVAGNCKEGPRKWHSAQSSGESSDTDGVSPGEPGGPIGGGTTPSSGIDSSPATTNV